MPYADAPPDRYVWAPPEVRESVAAPVNHLAPVNPVPTVTIAEDLRAAVASEDHRGACVPPDYRSGTA
jgi:hypothetical protein